MDEETTGTTAELDVPPMPEPTLADLMEMVAEIAEWQRKATAAVEDVTARVSALMDNPMIKQFVEMQSSMMGL